MTVNVGTNVLGGQDRWLLDSELTRILEGGAKKGSIPPLWTVAQASGSRELCIDIALDE